MRSRALLIFFAVVCLWACAGCSMFRKHKKITKEPPPPVHNLIGTIVSVNEAGRFVLIDTGGVVTATKGAALKSFAGKEETAVLTVSPEQKPPFMIADIVHGSPHNGDQVMQ